MFNFEIVLIVLLCAVPFVALLMVLPKIKKKDKKKEVTPVKTYQEIKQEEKQNVQVEETPKQASQPKNISDEITIDKDFENYLDFKRRNSTRPSRVELPKDFMDRTTPYQSRRKRVASKPKNITEEIQNLSPELKTLIIAGVLEPKDFDKI